MMLNNLIKLSPLFPFLMFIFFHLNPQDSFHFLFLFFDKLSFWMNIIVVLICLGVAFQYLNKFYFIISFSFFLLFLFESIFSFFFFFETLLIPFVWIVFIEGKSKDRFKASFFMFFYTLISSMPLMFFILLLLNNGIYFFSPINFFLKSSFFFKTMYFFMTLAFLVKMPIFFFHSWLPKAHVEASTLGSIFLASILLKLGGYGLYRFLMYSYAEGMVFFLSLSLISSIFSSLMCLYQSDLKIIIAFSSIAHMSMCLFVCFFQKEGSLMTFILLNISHSFISGSLFHGFGIFYELMKTRSNLLLKGATSTLSIFSFFWLIVCFSNMSFPPSSGFFGEWIFSKLVLSKELAMFTTLLIIAFFFVGIYSLFLYSSITHSKTLLKTSLFQKNEYLNTLLLWVIWTYLFPLFIIWM